MINNGERVLIKTVTSLSFTGVITNREFIYDEKESVVMQPSNESKIQLIIPKDEIVKVFLMSGEVTDNV